MSLSRIIIIVVFLTALICCGPARPYPMLVPAPSVVSPVAAPSQVAPEKLPEEKLPDLGQRLGLRIWEEVTQTSGNHNTYRTDSQLNLGETSLYQASARIDGG